LELFDLDADIGEKKNVAAENPEVVKRLQALAGKAMADLGNEQKKGAGQREAGWVEKTEPLLLK